MNTQIVIGSKVKLVTYEDEDYGSCEGLARLNGIDLYTVLTVKNIKVECNEVFLSFEPPYSNFYGWSANRFKLVEG